MPRVMRVAHASVAMFIVDVLFRARRDASGSHAAAHAAPFMPGAATTLPCRVRQERAARQIAVITRNAGYDAASPAARYAMPVSPCHARLPHSCFEAATYGQPPKPPVYVSTRMATDDKAAFTGPLDCRAIGDAHVAGQLVKIRQPRRLGFV